MLKDNELMQTQAYCMLRFLTFSVENVTFESRRLTVKDFSANVLDEWKGRIEFIVNHFMEKFFQNDFQVCSWKIANISVALVVIPHDLFTPNLDCWKWEFMTNLLWKIQSTRTSISRLKIQIMSQFFFFF